MSAGPVRVVAAAVLEGDRLLISRRRRDAHLGGLWELPGGKVEPGETDAAALTREIHEEVGIAVSVGARLDRIVHRYPDRTVELVVYRCTWLGGTPRAIEVAEVVWAPLATLEDYRFPKADAPLITRLRAEAAAS